MAKRATDQQLSSLPRLVTDYGKRFKSRVPVHVARRASVLGMGELVEKLERSLREGRPVPEWHSEVERSRAVPAAERSLEESLNAEPLP